MGSTSVDDEDGDSHSVRAELKDSKKPAARTAVYVPYLSRDKKKGRTPLARLEEAVGLARAIELDVVVMAAVPLERTRPGTLLGSGKVAEIAEIVAEQKIEVVVVDFPVSPIQQKNLEKEWKCKVVDRTGLILEIFGARARTKEGRLQVEHAHLTYQKGRLVRSWTHLERQRGGFGFLGGPGETQIETDRRLLQERLDAIERDLEVVVKTRDLHRKGRTKVPYPVIAIVGYTNAGKSTLFNTLTGADVLAKDMLFATLDPTLRELKLPSGRKVILSDTVGFISDLPTMLVAAFRATLEEVISAELILHVRDVSHADSEEQRADVEKILTGLGIDPSAADSKLIEVWNKSDLVESGRREVLANSAPRGAHHPVLVSALKGDGLDTLLALIDESLGERDELLSLTLPPAEGALAAWVHQNAEVLEKSWNEDGQQLLKFRIGREALPRLKARLAERGMALQS